MSRDKTTRPDSHGFHGNRPQGDCDRERREKTSDKGTEQAVKEVKRRIAELEKWMKEKSAKKESRSANLFHPIPIHSPQPPTLLELLNTAMQQAGQPNSRYGEIRDLKTFAKVVSFLQSNNISTLSKLQETLSGMKKRYWNTNSEIKQTEKLLHEQKELIDQAEKYLQYRDFHKAYKHTKPKKREEDAQRHHAELTLYDRAERRNRKGKIYYCDPVGCVLQFWCR